MVTVNNTRITRAKMFMGVAWMNSLRGTCNRLQVGAVITLGNRIVSAGYNGAPSGMPHCDSNCNAAKPCLNTIHAEDNALRWAYMNLGRMPVGGTMYVTHQPCISCAEKIVDAGIAKVVYSDEYRCKDGLDYLVGHSVEVSQCKIPMDALNAAYANSAIIPE